MAKSWNIQEEGKSGVAYRAFVKANKYSVIKVIKIMPKHIEKYVIKTKQRFNQSMKID